MVQCGSQRETNSALLVAGCYNRSCQVDQSPRIRYIGDTFDGTAIENFRILFCSLHAAFAAMVRYGWYSGKSFCGRRVGPGNRVDLAARSTLAATRH